MIKSILLKAWLAILIFGLLSAEAIADNCTRSVEGFISGLAMDARGKQQLAHIKTLLESNTDCEVIAQIPILALSKKAVAAQQRLKLNSLE